MDKLDTVSIRAWREAGRIGSGSPSKGKKGGTGPLDPIGRGLVVHMERAVDDGDALDDVPIRQDRLGLCPRKDVEETHRPDLQAGCLADLTPRGLLARLAEFHEAPRNPPDSLRPQLEPDPLPPV